MNVSKIRGFLSDLFFPKFCFGCQKEGTYLCPDCRATLEISPWHQKFPQADLLDLYFPLEYKSPLLKKLIQTFKYEPFIKELAGTLAFLIIEHFQLLEKSPNFRDFVLIPVPLEKRKLKWRGYNQAEEIARELGKFFGIPLISNCLIKTKETLSQVELSEKERKENLKGVFSLQERERISAKKILLVDDIYTTGATMRECAKVLKQLKNGIPGAKEIIGIVIARARPGEDKFQRI